MLEQGRCGRPHYLSMTICNLTKKQGFGKLGSRVFFFFFFFFFFFLFYVSRVSPGETVKPEHRLVPAGLAFDKAGGNRRTV